MELKKDVQQIVEKTKKERTKGLNETIKQCSIELYEVSNSYDCKSVIQNIKNVAESLKASYVIAFHDKDIFTENTFDSNHQLVGRKGEPKKSHYHIQMQFSSRQNIGDLALKIGVEDRWILRLKHDYDFDNMIVYDTHENYIDKHHYDYHDFDTNISEYVEFLVEKNRDKLEQAEMNIVYDFINVLSQYDKPMSYPLFYETLYSLGYSISDIKPFYQMLKDILLDHNAKCVCQQDINETAERKLVEWKINDRRAFESAIKSVDTFGYVTVEHNGKKYVLTNAQIKKGR